MYASNPMALPGEHFIYHTRKPRFLAVRTGSAFKVVDDIDDIHSFFNHQPEKLEGLLKRMNDWYIAYCTHNK